MILVSFKSCNEYANVVVYLFDKNGITVSKCIRKNQDDAAIIESAWHELHEK